MTAARPVHEVDDGESAAEHAPAPALVLVESPTRDREASIRRLQAMIAILVFPAAVVLTVIAIRLPADGRATRRPPVELIGGPPGLADRLSASGLTVELVPIVPAARNSVAATTSIVYYHGADRAAAENVRDALGRGTIEYRPTLGTTHGITVVAGKDVDQG
jgi:hypothetical protein